MGSKVDANDKRLYGVYSGIVTSVDDDTHEGQVKVKFLWYDGGKTEFRSRVRQSYAGEKFGAFFIPEPKMEVLVAFMHGRMGEPVILGGLYNGKDKPPTYRTDSKDEKMFQTKAGHRIAFIDTGGSEQIFIVEKNGKNKIVIDTANNSITISSDDGTINVTAKEINVKSTGDTNIDAGGDVNIKGSNVNVKGSAINLN